MAPIDALRIQLAGFGGVGRALARALARRPEFRVVAVTDSHGTVWREGGVDAAALAERKEQSRRLVPSAKEHEASWNATEALTHVNPDVLVEVLPTDLDTGEPGLTLAKASADLGVSVVLADKGPLAVAPRATRAAFEASGASLRHGATVGGGVPILETLERLRASDDILGITAVANGSTSFVLDRVEKRGSLAEAIEAAKHLGLLETNPLLDLAGHDAAAKAAILHQVAFGSALSWKEVAAKGLLSLDEEDVRFQAERGFAVRLVANVSPDGARVAPVAVERDSPLATKGAGNAFQVRLAEGGSVTLAGPGAGPRETARTILRDLQRLAERTRRVQRLVTVH